MNTNEDTLPAVDLLKKYKHQPQLEKLRRAMKQAGLTSLPLYPEERLCRAPATDRILELLQELRRMKLYRRQRRIQTFPAALLPIQEQCRILLDVPLTDALSVD